MLRKKLLGILKELREESGIRASMIIKNDGTLLAIHEDAVYVPKKLRTGPKNGYIDKNFFSKWSTSIIRTVEFVSEKLFENGINNMILEGNNNYTALIFTIEGKSLLIGVFSKDSHKIGIAYSAMKSCVEKVTKIFKENDL